MTSLRRNSRHLPHLCALALIGISTLPGSLSAQRMRIGSSNPTGVAAGLAFSDALFAAGDTNRGVELWRYTATGTSRLIDIYPGVLSSYPTEITRRSPSNGNTWLVARSLDSSINKIGRELHYYPNLPNPLGGFVKDIRSGTASSNPSELTLVGPRLFFTADDGISGRELWTSDGTIAGTVRVKDILPGSNGANPFGLIAYSGRVFFAATTASGTELWSSDGTAVGTVQVKDIRPGVKSSTPTQFTVYAGRLYFAATTDASGRELWVSNGTTAGTVLYADIHAGARSSAPTQLTAGSTLAFTASTAIYGRELYILSTTGATLRRSNLPRGESIACITPVGKQFWFRAFTAALGHELWRTNASGIQLVHNLRAGADSSFPANLRAFGNGVLFRADNGAKGMEYWRSDGITATLIRDIRPNDCSSRPSVLFPVNSGGRPIYLFGAKGNHNGIEFWQTNGIVASLVMDIDPKPVLPGLHWHSTPTQFIIDIKDSQANQLAWVVVGTAVAQPLTLPNIRGALSVNLLSPVVIFPPVRTNNAGEATIRFTKPPILQRTSLVSQALVSTIAGSLEVSAASTCNHGFRDLNPPPGTPPNGPRVEAEICLDDESGEYTICAKRTDINPAAGYLGLYQKGPGGDLELLQSYPINAGEEVLDSGQIEILLPLDFFDSPGRHLELHLFHEEPTPESANSGSLVVQSYC